MTSIFSLRIPTPSDNVSASTSGGSSTVSAQSEEPNKLDRARNAKPYSTRKLHTLSHSAYYPEFLNNLKQFILLTNSLKAKPQLQINALLKTNDLLIPKTQTKSGKEIDYLPAPYSAVMINNQGALYKQLNNAFNTLEEQKSKNNDFLLSSETSNRVLKNIAKMLLTAIKYLGFHEVSGAKYAALATYHNDNGFHDFALSSNNDPKSKDFGNPKMRRCAEDSMSIIAKENKLNKLKYLFLMRGPYPEGYGDNNNGVFKFSKLVPCKSCLQHLEKLYENGGNLIIVASINQGKFLEKSLGELNIDSSANQARENQPQQQNYLLENQQEGDIRIIYPKGLEHCFIEIPNKNLPRIIVEKDIGTNVLSRGTQCQDSREAFTFGEWLQEQKISREAQELFDTKNLNRAITWSSPQ